MFGLVRTPQPLELEDPGYARVTREDMRTGVPGRASACAIAVALKRRFPDEPVIVGVAAWRVGYLGGTHYLTFRQSLFVFLYDVTRGRIRWVWPEFRIKVG